jgi:nitrile hydratase accessory protein
MTALHMTLAEVAAACAADGAGLPLPADTAGERHFSEPWQAHAFALTLMLHRKGVFSWVEWAQALAERIRQARLDGDPDDGSGYYRHWMDALEQLMIARGIASAEQLHALEHAWAQAAERTPHGQPIVLESADDGAQPPPAHAH